MSPSKESCLSKLSAWANKSWISTTAVNSLRSKFGFNFQRRTAVTIAIELAKTESSSFKSLTKVGIIVWPLTPFPRILNFRLWNIKSFLVENEKNSSTHKLDSDSHNQFFNIFWVFDGCLNFVFVSICSFIIADRIFYKTGESFSCLESVK